jgi:hypothetical protein
MSIPLITNFTINQNSPIDDRLVVTNSSSRDSIVYKYDGLTIFKTDDRTNWIYNANSATWSNILFGNGIYGGNGALNGDTYIFTGNMPNTSGSISNRLILSASSSVSGIYFSSYFNRTVFGSDWQNVQYIMQYSHDSNSNNNAYISFNPSDPFGLSIGGIDFGTSNTRRFTITNNGIIRLWSPTYSIDLNSSNIMANNIYYLPNKTGTLAMTSDVNTLAATVSMLSLQSITSVGATSSYPITINNMVEMTSSYVTSTFSVGNYLNIIPSNNQSIYYIDSYNYIIKGIATGIIYIHNLSPTGASSQTYGSIAVPANSYIYVEFIYNSICYYSTSPFGSSLSWYRQNKIVYTLTVDSLGNITIANSSSIYSYNNDTVHSIGQDGIIDVSNVYTIKFKQIVNTPPPSTNFDIHSKVDYNIFVSTR